MTTAVIIEAWITHPAIKKHKHKLVRRITDQNNYFYLFLIIINLILKKNGFAY